MADTPTFTGSNAAGLLTAMDPVTIANAGAGFLSDLAKMAARDGVTFDLDDVAARNSGAGFIADCLRMVAQGL